MARLRRDLKREQTWRRHLEQQRSSGLTARAFCSLHRLSDTILSRCVVMNPNPPVHVHFVKPFPEWRVFMA